ncbi:MAG: fibronectin type III domain-containing protein [Pyrinomonadaceae bacterium]
MATRIYPVNDAEFAIWLKNFINKSNANLAALNMTAAQTADLQAKLTTFEGDLDLKQQKKEESVAQTALVKTERAELNKIVGLLNNGIKSIDGLAPNIIEEIGLNVNESTGSGSAPTAPSDLVVTGTSDGTNHLKWKRNGNRQGTIFVIEGKFGDAATWTIVDVVTSSNYDHTNQTPGVKAQYRIKAKRGDLESGPSNTAVVYG